MQLHTIDRKTAPDFRTKKSETETLSDYSACAIDEINAYIAVRDSQLTQAEQAVTLENLRRVELANAFVESCLNPARSPYEAQNFPETSARFERKRCEVIKNRIAELRAAIASKAPAQAA
jgi:actin-related protein